MGRCDYLLFETKKIIPFPILSAMALKENVFLSSRSISILGIPPREGEDDSPMRETKTSSGFLLLYVCQDACLYVQP